MRRAVVAGLVVFAALALWRLVPFVTDERTIFASTPGVRPLGPPAEVALPVCVEPVILEPRAQAVQVEVRAGGAPITVQATGPGGFRATGRSPGGYAPGAVLTIPLRAAPRELAGSRLCLQGRGVTLLGGAAGRDLAGVRASTGDAVPWVALVEREQRSLLSRTGTLLDRLAAWRPWTGWLLWPALLALLLGAPAAVLVAVARSEDEEA